MGLRALFLDAGNTLVFPSYERTLAPLHSRGISVTREQIRDAERAARRFRDAHASLESAADADHRYWDIYYDHLLSTMGLRSAELQAELVAAARVSMNWRRIEPDTCEILLRLRKVVKTGLISNSDGHIAELIGEVGLADCFDSITDSSRVGFQKPDRRIFEAALESLGVAAAEAMYVGDVYSIDYLGARNAGMQAMLLDAYGVYCRNGVPRVESLCVLEHIVSCSL